MSRSEQMKELLSKAGEVWCAAELQPEEGEKLLKELLVDRMEFRELALWIAEAYEKHEEECGD